MRTLSAEPPRLREESGLRVRGMCSALCPEGCERCTPTCTIFCLSDSDYEGSTMPVCFFGATVVGRCWHTRG